jgi:hypothetical protein
VLPKWGLLNQLIKNISTKRNKQPCFSRHGPFQEVKISHCSTEKEKQNGKGKGKQPGVETAGTNVVLNAFFLKKKRVKHISKNKEYEFLTCKRDYKSQLMEKLWRKNPN